jgi:hypothetical protein
LGSLQYFKIKRYRGKVSTPLNKKLENVEWGEFKLGDLFEINPTKYYKFKNKEIISENGKISLISNSSTDNGVMGDNALKNPDNFLTEFISTSMSV